MASPISCDVHGQEHLADFIVTRLEDGDSLGACGAAYLELCRLVVEQADQPERDETDAAALAALESAGAAGNPPTSASSSDEAEAAPEPPTKPAGGRQRAEPDSDTSPEPIAAPEAS